MAKKKNINAGTQTLDNGTLGTVSGGFIEDTGGVDKFGRKLYAAYSKKDGHYVGTGILEKAKYMEKYGQMPW